MVKLFSVLLFFLPVVVQSQSYVLTGEVIDRTTLSKIEGAYITCDAYNAITDKNGMFSITVLGSSGRKKLTFIHIGYSTKNLICYANKKNIIRLAGKATILSEVIIKPKKSILEQAIENIPVNYPIRPVMQRGLIRLHYIAKECDYFFRGDAVVDLYTPTYGSTHQEQQIKIQHNERTLVESRKECAKLPVWVAAYTTIHDVVFEKPAFISADKLDNYSYHSKGMIDYNGRRTYLLNFASRKGAKAEGVIYIDSLTKAFSAIEYTRYDVHKLFFVPIAVWKCKIEYQLNNGKWYINRTRRQAFYDKKFIHESIQEFQSLGIDSLDVKPIPYPERVQYMDDVTVVLKKDTLGNNYDTLLAKHEFDSTLTILPIPERKDSILLKPESLKEKVFRFILATKPAIALRNAPLTTGYYPSYLPNTIGMELSFPAYKKLFTRFSSSDNFGIGTLKIQYITLSLEREIISNVNHRPIRIIPHSGFSFLFSKEKGTSNSNTSINYIVGVRVAIEISRGMSFFVNGDYLKNLKKTGSIPDFTFMEISFSTGLMFHLKKYK